MLGVDAMIHAMQQQTIPGGHGIAVAIAMHLLITARRDGNAGASNHHQPASSHFGAQVTDECILIHGGMVSSLANPVKRKGLSVLPWRMSGMNG